MKNDSREIFLALVRAGLVAAGLERVKDISLSKAEVLPFLTNALSLERRGVAMNQFIGEMFRKMEDCGICALLVKGQGVAQCYERPRPNRRERKTGTSHIPSAAGPWNVWD